jgi:hypothetical protein
MSKFENSQSAVRSRALLALQEAFRRQRPDVHVDERGYVGDFRETLLPMVFPEDFEEDLNAGDGNELENKFCALHSSSGLAVNCFAPFRSRITDLNLQSVGGFDSLQFERKCPTGLKGGRSPNLDVLLSGQSGVIGVESKLTEYLGRHQAKFSPAYEQQICDSRREQGYFREMLRLIAAPDSYVWLDAAQLIKHAFGLTHTFKDVPVSLLYLFWEPVNPDANPVFAAHRAEIAEFAERVSGATTKFVAMSYRELWTDLRKTAPHWLNEHLGKLEARYMVYI